MKVSFYFICREFYLMHEGDTHILDVKDPNKQGKRSHICIEIIHDGNHYFIPLRENLAPAVRPYGRIGHEVPSKRMPKAGLDYRNAIIINNPILVSIQNHPSISGQQYRQIIKEYKQIVKEFSAYLNGFKTAYRGGVISDRPLYKNSSLNYFLKELRLK